MLVSWKSVHGALKEFFVLMLILETAMTGVFVSLDLFLFYVFWEATLIPMALMIGMYGHERRIYAAVKFFLYTMVASVFMLAAIIWFYVQTGSFAYVTIQNAIQSGSIAGFNRAAEFLFFGFFIAFAVKVPLSTPGSRMRTSRRRLPVPCFSPAFCSKWERMDYCDSTPRSSLLRRMSMRSGSTSWL